MPSKLFKKNLHQLQKKRSRNIIFDATLTWHGIPEQQRQVPRSGFKPLPRFWGVRDRYARSAQVQRATHPLLGKPKLRGDGGIAPPLMVPELRLIGLTTYCDCTSREPLRGYALCILLPRDDFPTAPRFDLKRWCASARGAL